MRGGVVRAIGLVGGVWAALLGCVVRDVGEGGSTSGAETGGGSTGGGSTAQVPTSGGEASSGTGSAGTTGDSGDTGFIAKPDAGGIGTVECDVYKQDCRDGQKCAAWASTGSGAWDGAKCVEVIGDQQPGEPCTAMSGPVAGVDDCAKGAMCWDVSPENVGVCVPLCMGTSDSPVCEGHLVCSAGALEWLNLCFPICDPLIQDCQGDGICVLSDDEVLCVEDASGEMGAVNDPCEQIDECDKGLACVDSATASSACMQGVMGCCQPFCEFVEGEGGECPNPDQVCLQLDVPWGLDSRGVCGVPG